jgi:hypothetical protein
MKARLSGLFLVFLAATGLPALAQADDDCLLCHDQDDLLLIPESIHGALEMACVDCHADLADVELPHEAVDAVDCGTCHDTDDWTESIHGQPRQDESGDPAASCVDCHGAHDIHPADDPTSPSYHLNISETCTRCHGPEQGPEGAKRIDEDRVHGAAMHRRGLLVAPTCSTCHGAHDIKLTDHEDSHVGRANLAKGCGSCHAGILLPYGQDVHGSAVAAGSEQAPVCSDCHAIHAVERPHLAAWRREVIDECGRCHEDSIDSFRDTFHGQVSTLGYTRVATCSDCHRAHGIYPVDDPASSMSRELRVETCRECHPRASANFVDYDPHADHHDPERSTILWAAGLFMKYLLIGVFSFFGLHTLLWFPRSLKVRKERT